MVEFESLLSLLSNVYLCRDVANSRIWKSNSLGLFSSKSFDRELDPINKVRSSCALVWRGLAPPRVGWLWQARSRQQKI